jgi:hypothetical protein
MASPHWQDEPEAHDFPAALDYLGLLFRPAEAAKLVDRLRGAETVAKKAKDILRASRLPLLPADDPNVAKDLAKVRDGKKLSPVLLVRGRAAKGVPLTIADGYHRICASYHVDEDEEVACRLVEPR